MRSLTVPVSDASKPVFRVLSSESWLTGSAGTDRRHRVRFARFVTAPRSPATEPLFFLKEKKSVGCELPPVACGKPAFFRFSIGDMETVYNLAGSSVDRYQVPHISTVQLSGVVVHGRPGGWPSVLFVNEYNPQRLWAGAALFCGCPHEPVAPVGECGVFPQSSIGRGYGVADIFSPLAACGYAAGVVAGKWRGHAGSAVSSVVLETALPVGSSFPPVAPVAGAVVQFAGESGGHAGSAVSSVVLETALPVGSSFPVGTWRRPAGRVSPRRAARVAVLGLAVLVAGTLTSCTTLAPVVRCVPDSAVLPCK